MNSCELLRSGDQEAPQRTVLASEMSLASHNWAFALNQFLWRMTGCPLHKVDG